MRFEVVRGWLLTILVIAPGAAGLWGGEAGPHWERFRGPNGTGTSDDKNIPVTFGPNENLIWKVAVPGAGNSSPVIWGTHLFLHGASADSKRISYEFRRSHSTRRACRGLACCATGARAGGAVSASCESGAGYSADSAGSKAGCQGFGYSPVDHDPVHQSEPASEVGRTGRK